MKNPNPHDFRELLHMPYALQKYMHTLTKYVDFDSHFFFEKSTCKWPSEVNGDVYFEKTTWILVFGGVQSNFFSFSFPQTFWSTPYEIYEYMKATRKREEFFGSTSASSNVPFERHKERLRGKYRGEDGGGWQCISQPLCYRKGFHMSPRKSCFLL